MGLVAHEQGCSLLDPSFPLLHHWGHGKPPELVLPSQLEEVAARAEVGIGQAISLSHFCLLAGLQWVFSNKCPAQLRLRLLIPVVPVIHMPSNNSSFWPCQHNNWPWKTPQCFGLPAHQPSQAELAMAGGLSLRAALCSSARGCKLCCGHCCEQCWSSSHGPSVPMPVPPPGQFRSYGKLTAPPAALC